MLILMLIAIPKHAEPEGDGQNETSAKQSAARDSDRREPVCDELPAQRICVLAGGAGRDASAGWRRLPQSAQLLQSDLTSGNKAGYSFNIVNCQKAPGQQQQDNFVSYEVTAVAAVGGETGHSGSAWT